MVIPTVRYRRGHRRKSKFLSVTGEKANFYQFSRRKGDVEKVALAQRLREETTMTLAWIAERLQMGSKTHLAHLLYWQRRNRP